MPGGGRAIPRGIRSHVINGRPGYSAPVRRGPSVLVLAAGATLVALLGGAVALGIGAGAGWIGKSTKTVVINARSLSAGDTALPAVMA